MYTRMSLRKNIQTENFTAEEEIIIKQMTEDGFLPGIISKTINKNTGTIYTFITENKIKIKPEKFDGSQEMMDCICDLYNRGALIKTLIQKYNLSTGTIRGWVTRKGFIRSGREGHKKIFFDESIMDIIDTPAKAYWLGFCYADAYNSCSGCSFSITLKGDDESHIRKLATFFHLDQEQVIIETNPDKYKTAGIHIHSKYFCEIMTKHGCMNAKSFIIKYPEWLNESLNSHFIRGMVDGDGSICHTNREWKFNLVSTKECLDSIGDIIFKNIGIRPIANNISETGNNTWAFSIRGNEQVKKIFDWLYEDSTVETRLDRKYERYLQLIDQQANRRFSRENYRVTENIKEEIRANTTLSILEMVDKYKIHERTVRKIIAYKDNNG
jgi:hypothetical protein